jgi:hypothetical protein
MILSLRIKDLEKWEPACGRTAGEVGPARFFFYFAKISFVPGRELPGQMDKGHLSRMLNPG